MSLKRLVHPTGQPSGRRFLRQGRTLRFFVVTTAMALAFGSGHAAPSEPTLESIARSHPFYGAVVRLDPNARMGFRLYLIQPWALIRHGPVDLFFLCNSQVQNELGLSLDDTSWLVDRRRESKGDILRLQENMRNIRRSAYAKYLIEGTFRYADKEEFDAYTKYSDSIHRKIEARFPARTMTRLYQCQVRYRILNGGLIAALRLDRGLAGALGVDASTLARLEADLPRVRAKLDNAVHPVFKRLMTEVEDVLHEQQLQSLMAALRDAPPTGVPVIEHMLWQCWYAQEDRQATADDVLTEHNEIAGFYVAASGQLLAHRREVDNGLFWVLESLTGDGDGAVRQEQIDQFWSTFLARMQQSNDELSRIQWDWWFGLVGDKEREKVWLENGKLSRETALSVLKETLDERQWERFLGALRERSLQQRGLLPSLTTGSLGKEIEITTKQRDKLRRIASKYATELIELSRKLEGVVWSEISKSLTREQRKRLRRLIGEPPMKMPGSPTLIIMTNGREMYREDLERFAASRDRMLERIFGPERTSNPATK